MRHTLGNQEDPMGNGLTSHATVASFDSPSRLKANADVHTVGLGSADAKPPRRRLLIALYLGAITLIFGSSGISVHRYTRGTLDPHKPTLGLGWSS
jgi:hypothetical protein